MADDQASSGDVTRIPVAKLRQFIDLINKNDLWGDVEQHLDAQGITHIPIGTTPMAEISSMLQSHQAADRLVSPQADLSGWCSCRTPSAGGQPAKYPSGGPGDAGAPDGGGVPSSGPGSSGKAQ